MQNFSDIKEYDSCMKVSRKILNDSAWLQGAFFSIKALRNISMGRALPGKYSGWFPNLSGSSAFVTVLR
jgi:hypothetical protein